MTQASPASEMKEDIILAAHEVTGQTISPSGLGIWISVLNDVDAQAVHDALSLQIKGGSERLGPFQARSHAFKGSGTMEAIAIEVSSKTGIPLMEIKGSSRFKNVCMARDEAAYRIRRDLEKSFAQIGHYLGGRDHSTIVEAVKRHQARLGLGSTVGNQSSHSKTEGVAA